MTQMKTPDTSFWLLARPQSLGGRTYYGAYPRGALGRARRMIGCADITTPVLHVCGGRVKHYPFKDGFGPKDKTLDLDASLEPDYVADARDPYPRCPYTRDGLWPGILSDPPYNEAHAKNYKPGASVFPPAATILRNMLEAVRPGGCVGLLHFISPPAPKKLGFVFAYRALLCGSNNQIRIFSFYQRHSDSR